MKRTTLLLTLILIASIGVRAQNVATNCYRGFVDLGYAVGIGDYGFGRVEVNTSHGYQINPYLFIGAGVGLHFAASYETSDMEIALDTRDSKVDIPVFANAHFNFMKKKFSPFVDIKGGTYVNNGGGLYVSASVGCRIAINKKQGINIGVGYASEKLEFETFEHFVGKYSLDYTRKAAKLDTEAITMRVGFEF